MANWEYGNEGEMVAEVLESKAILAARGSYDQPDPNKLYAIPMPNKHRGICSPPASETITVLVKPYPENDGLMVGFLDPFTGAYCGCCGIFHWNEKAKQVHLDLDYHTHDSID